MTVVNDVAAIVKDIYPLYLKVYERSNLQFEKLTERYFCGLGRDRIFQADVFGTELVALDEAGTIPGFVAIHGFARVPSMPNTRLNIDYANFDDYMNKTLGQEMRRNLRRCCDTT
jgi:hypothetical protein